MIKLVVLLFGLGIGFGVGVYWGVNHPVDAKKFADEEERRFVEAQKQLLEKLKSKLDQLASNRAGTAAPAGTGARSGFVAGAQGAASAAVRDPEVDALRADAQRQLDEVERILKQAGAK